MDTKKTLLVIFGEESTAIEIEETAKLYLTGYEILRVFYSEDFIKKYPKIQNALDSNKEIRYIISFSDFKMRKKCELYVQNLLNFKPKSVLHLSVYISSSAVIKEGCYIAANSVVSSNVNLAQHVLINYNATVGHDVQINKHVIIMPGAKVSGHVRIGEGTILGANSFIFQNLEIGRNNIIDALTAIHKSLGDNMISAARVTKSFKQINK